MIDVDKRRLSSREARAFCGLRGICSFLCHSERNGRALLPAALRPRGHEVEESLFAFKIKALLVLALALLLAAPVFAQAPAQSSDRAQKLGKQLMCTCGCGDTAGECSHPGAAFSGPCDVAKGKLKEMNERIGRGESDSAILSAFVREFGEAALAAPPARGFNWFAYTFPAIAFAIGLALVIMIIRVWRRPVATPASGPAVSAEMLEHARRQIERDLRDD